MSALHRALVLMIVMMAGLPGSGKSTLARAVAKRVGGVVLDKDSFRASLFPKRLIEYSTEQDDFVVRVMLDVAEYLLRRQPRAIVILDGRPFSRKYQVDAVVASAQRIKTAWSIVECVCPEKVSLQRLKADREHVAANRNAELYHEVKAVFHKIRRRKLVVKTSLKLDSCVERVTHYLGQSFPGEKR